MSIAAAKAGRRHVFAIFKGHEKNAFINTVISYWAVVLPASYILAFVFDLKGSGIWLGMIFGLATAAVALLEAFLGSIASRLAIEKGLLVSFRA